MELQKAAMWERLEKTIQAVRGQGASADPATTPVKQIAMTHMDPLGMADMSSAAGGASYAPSLADSSVVDESLDNPLSPGGRSAGDALFGTSPPYKGASLLGSSPSGAGASSSGGKERHSWHSRLLAVRKAAANKMQQLADNVATSINRSTIQLSMTLHSLEGPMLMWLGPPPTDRIWLSFVGDPVMNMEVRPLLSNRMLRYSAAVVRVSEWLQRKMQKAFRKNMVHPQGVDFKIPIFWSLDKANMPVRTVLEGALMGAAMQASLAAVMAAPAPVPAAAAAAAGEGSAADGRAKWSGV